MSELTLGSIESLAVPPSKHTQKSSEVNTLKPEAKEPVPSLEPKMDTEQVQEAVSRMNEYVQLSERRLDFRLDEDSGLTVIKVFDKESEELIRQIPGELALKLAQRLNDEEPTLLFHAQV